MSVGATPECHCDSNKQQATAAGCTMKRDAGEKNEI
jgi:hypothetical protein